MKKTLAAAITSALVIGVASTTFAAANPFSDVPADHWSFDAVAKLAQEGVIEGYGDNTFRGDAHITRYEMAQMVAKAMAKEDVSGADKATIDKLAAEYADELNTLGVRVANLEKKSDNVKFDGLARYTYTDVDNNGAKTSKNEGLARLNVTGQVNDNWAVKARFESKTDFKDNSSSTFDTKRIYVQGPLFGSDAKMGKLATYSAQGLIMDKVISGGEFKWTNGDLTAMATAGRYDSNDYQAFELGYKASDKLNLTAGYNRLADKNISGTDDNIGIWSVGAGYNFTKDLALNGIYAQSNVDDALVVNDSDKAYSVELAYKGAKANVAGSYGAFVAYRFLGDDAVFAPTYDAIGADQKGIEVGMNYTFDKNIVGTVKYFDGKEISTKEDNKKFFGKVEFLF